MAGMARAMGATLTGAQKLLGKNLNISLQFLEPLFCAPYIHKLQSCSNTAPLRRACCASTTKHYDKTVRL